MMLSRNLSLISSCVINSNKVSFLSSVVFSFFLRSYPPWLVFSPQLSVALLALTLITIPFVSVNPVVTFGDISTHRSQK